MKKYLTMVFVLVLALAGCKSTQSTDQSDDDNSEAVAAQAEEGAEQAAPTKKSGQEVIEALPEVPDEPGLEIATFAGGCFWCMEPPFDKTEGVERTIVGYTGGTEEHPTYKEVASGQTSHAEAVRVYYDPEKVSYEKLLDVFWRNINPTQENGQFVDIGSQYRSAVFYHDEEQEKLARDSKQELSESERFEKPIVTEIEPAQTFWKAEEYHQNFYKKSPVRYKSYRRGSGRDEYIEEKWGDE